MAQRLYEAGYITYMRTDSTNLSSDAVAAAREYIEKEFGAAVSARATQRLCEQSGGAGSARSDSSVQRRHGAESMLVGMEERCGAPLRNDLAPVRRMPDAAGANTRARRSSRRPAISKRASAVASCVSTGSRACCRRWRAKTKTARCRTFVAGETLDVEARAASALHEAAAALR